MTVIHKHLLLCATPNKQKCFKGEEGIKTWECLKKTLKSLDNDDPEYSCLGSKNKKVCLKNMRLIRELEIQNSKILTDLKTIV